MLKNRPRFISNFSQLNAFKKAKTIKSNTRKMVINGKPINANGKRPGEPRQDL